MPKRFNPQRYRTEAQSAVSELKAELAARVAQAFTALQRELISETPVLSGELVLNWEPSVNQPVLSEEVNYRSPAEVKLAKKLKYEKREMLKRIARKEGDVERHQEILAGVEAQLAALAERARREAFGKLKPKSFWAEAIIAGAKSLHLSNAAPYSRRQNNEHRSKAHFVERAVENFKGRIK